LAGAFFATAFCCGFLLFAMSEIIIMTRAVAGELPPLRT
jgi:hypothetical protein